METGAHTTKTAYDELDSREKLFDLAITTEFDGPLNQKYHGIPYEIDFDRVMVKFWESETLQV